YAHICVSADRELLGAAEPERHLGTEKDRIDIEEIVEAISKGEPVIIIFASQDQVVRFGQNHRESRAKIEAAKVQGAEFIVVKFLPLDAQRPVESLGESWRIGDPGRGRKNRVALLAV